MRDTERNATATGVLVGRASAWLVTLTVLSFGGPAFGLEVGALVDDLKLRDGKTNEEVSLPDFGQKVVTIFYTDADVADQNDALADAMRKRKLDLSRHRSFGVVNLEDSKAPNFIIRAIVKGKVEKYQTTILNDVDRLLPRTWKIGDTNDTSVIIVIGKDRRVLYLKRGPVRGAEIDTVIHLIEGGMAAGEAP